MATMQCFHLDIASRISLLGIVAGIVIAILVPALNEMQVFKAHPDFLVKLNPYSDSKQQTLSITNIGLVQAKKLSVYVLANDTIRMENQSCFELTANSVIDVKTVRLDFERMSTGMLCDVGFTSDSKIGGFIITSEDSPARAYFPTVEKPGSIPSDVNTVVFKDAKQIVQPIYDLLMLGVVIEIIGTSTTFVIANLDRKRRLKKLEFEENKVMNSLDKYNKESSLLYEKFLFEELPEKIQSRFDVLHIGILEQKCKLDEIKTKKKIKKKLDGEIEEYFKTWREFEEKSIQLLKQEKIPIVGYTTIMEITDKIIENKKIEPTTLDSLNSIFDYRDKLTIGLAKATKKEINKNIEAVKKLSESLFYQKRSAI